MEVKELFCRKNILVNLEANKKEEAMEAMFKAMYNNRNVKESFLQNVLNREKKFPTGLKIAGFGIAIPHTDPENVLSPGISVAVLEKPVEFKRMDDAEESVNVRLIFMMALQDGHNHLKMISHIIKMLQDQSVLEMLHHAQSEEEVINIIYLNL